MDDDPIVAAVRKTREELARSLEYDVHAIFSDIRTREAKQGDRLIRQPDGSSPKQPLHPGGGSAGLPADDSSAAAG